jgi:hypothetical protein
MLSNIVKHKRDIRLPQDSGEWRPMPLEFRHLPPAADPNLPRKLIGTSVATALAQAMLLALATWAFFEYFNERDFPGLMVVAMVVGLVTAMAVGFQLARRHWLDSATAIAVVMRGQLWWLALMLIPCYGWGALFVLGVPCVFGSYFGAGLGAKLGRREDL